MSLAYAGGYEPIGRTWADAIVTIIHQFGLWGLVVILLALVAILLLWKVRK